ncbi:hypothetical protein Q9233_001835 [Columba guinea]|nr:hypothetical protein Q9233_001835 [Columba guinea]
MGSRHDCLFLRTTVPRCLAALAVLGCGWRPVPALSVLLVAQEKEPSISQKQQGQFREQRGRKEQGEKPSTALDVGRISAQCLLDVPESFMMMVELVDELLCIC